MVENGLNIFQRLTRRWEAVHPYNAAQVMRISGRIDPAAATGVWGDSLRALGLGRVRVCGETRFRHEVLNGELARFPVRMIPEGVSLQSHLTSELNRRFADPDEPPFRPFIVQLPDEFYFGVVYQHWVADSVSIRAVLREWFTRTYDPGLARARPLEQARDGYWRLFADRRPGSINERLLAAVRRHLRHRRARKVQTAGADDYPVRVTIHPVPAGLIDRIVQFARASQVKVHDLLLAALAEACDQFVPAQHRRNRPDISVGSILDLRQHAGADLADTFGLFLGFTNVVCRQQYLKDWPQLLRSVATQNRGNRQNDPAQSSLAWMLVALAVDRFVADSNLYHFYRKELPMLGGLSNVNLNQTWATDYHPEPLREYLRVSPTGPLVPLVFSTTTLGSQLSLVVTCRDSLLSAEAVSAMAESFLSRLDRASSQRSSAGVMVDNRAAK